MAKFNKEEAKAKESKGPRIWAKKDNVAKKPDEVVSIVKVKTQKSGVDQDKKQDKKEIEKKFEQQKVQVEE